MTAAFFHIAPSTSSLFAATFGKRTGGGAVISTLGSTTTDVPAR
ncbi:MAG TPA: hypothetical protein VFR86_25525 [Burkholderiaceae bacterium]|nr:hypothetical protein [Burkholderiaceae bacterium]